MDEYKKPSNDRSHKMVCHRAAELALCYVKIYKSLQYYHIFARMTSHFGKIVMFVYCTQYINRWGKLMIASEYGHKAWRFWVPVRRNKR